MHSLYRLADAKHMTLGALIGTEKRRFSIRLPRWLAWLLRRSELIIEEERDGVASREVVMWQAYYELAAEQQKRRK